MQHLFIQLIRLMLRCWPMSFEPPYIYIARHSLPLSYDTRLIARSISLLSGFSSVGGKGYGLCPIGSHLSALMRS